MTARTSVHIDRDGWRYHFGSNWPPYNYPFFMELFSEYIYVGNNCSYGHLFSTSGINPYFHLRLEWSLASSNAYQWRNPCTDSILCISTTTANHVRCLSEPNVAQLLRDNNGKNMKIFIYDRAPFAIKYRITKNWLLKLSVTCRIDDAITKDIIITAAQILLRVGCHT